VKAQPTLTIVIPPFVGNNDTLTLSGILTGIGNSPLAGRTVTLTIGTGSSAQFCTASSDASGTASCQIGIVNQPLGPGLSVTSAYGGDANYGAAATSTTTLVFAYPAVRGAGFVIGDRNAAIGASITFWGAQWDKLNSLSGGSATNSFKGFANRSTAGQPSCGATWASDPGNSSQPPDAVPQYMAVYVASTITKSGSTIGGNAPKIVIVRTNAGYGPNPGQNGTGTVVGPLCQ